MAENAANDLIYYLVVDKAQLDSLAPVRPWTNLKLAYEQDKVWVKGLSYAQLESAEVKCIPYKTLYYEREGRLSLLGRLLPERVVPSLLWTPIDRALPVKLPSLNHNFFGIGEKVPLQLLPAETEQEAEVMIADLATLGSYMETAPAIRFGQLSWAILNRNEAIVAGTPLLPIPAKVYWRSGHFIIPAGYAFELEMLCPAMDELLNPERDSWIVWHTDNTYALVPKDAMQSLSLGSFRASCRNHSIFAP